VLPIYRTKKNKPLPGYSLAGVGRSSIVGYWVTDVLQIYFHQLHLVSPEITIRAGTVDANGAPTFSGKLAGNITLGQHFARPNFGSHVLIPPFWVKNL
jgi:hypothetical protein